MRRRIIEVLLWTVFENLMTLLCTALFRLDESWHSILDFGYTISLAADKESMRGFSIHASLRFVCKCSKDMMQLEYNIKHETRDDQLLHRGIPTAE
jgi:hypothetical protein